MFRDKVFESFAREVVEKMCGGYCFPVMSDILKISFDVIK
jgi:hypothetical protein